MNNRKQLDSAIDQVRTFRRDDLKGVQEQDPTSVGYDYHVHDLRDESLGNRPRGAGR